MSDEQGTKRTPMFFRADLTIIQGSKKNTTTLPTLLVWMKKCARAPKTNDVYENPASRRVFHRVFVAVYIYT